MLLFLVFVIGALLGSFLNVLIDRLSTDRSFVKGRSYCEHCKKTLGWQDLIPLLSYIYLRGKCRFCKAKIPFRLFFVELLSGVIVASLFVLYANGMYSLPSILFLMTILLAFCGIFFADITYGIIPDLLVIVSMAATLGFLITTSSPIGPHIASGVGVFIFFLTLFVVTRGKGMGFGDVKLSFALGFLLGFPSIIAALYIAFLTGAVVSIILVVWKKLRFFGGTIPFGPFLVGSSVIALFFGESILHTFVSHFMQQ